MAGQEEHMVYEDDFIDYINGIAAIEEGEEFDFLQVYGDDEVNGDLLVSELKKRGVEAPKVLNKEVVDKLFPVLEDIASTLGNKIKERTNNVRLLEIEKAKLEQVYDSDEAKRQDNYEASPDKYDFLVEEYFNDNI